MASGAIDSKNFAWMWGTNTASALGDGTTTNRSSPVAVLGGHRFIQLVHTGNNNSAGLKIDGTAWCWGSGSNGTLGNNTTSSSNIPVAVVGSHTFVFIASNINGTKIHALKADGSAWSWGLGSNGGLGDNTATSKSSPVSIVGAHSFIKISGGGNTGLALKADGTAWSWGDATLGHLGDNSTTNKSSPVAVTGAHSFIFIFCNNNCSFGLKANGECWSWGRNNHAQLGDNSITNRSNPVSVVGAHSFIAITGNFNDTVCALKGDGTAWTWGEGSGGGLGDNTVTSKSSPVSVVGNHSFVAVSSDGFGQIFARKANGEIWGWGANTNGALGDNTGTASRSSPVLVIGGNFYIGLFAEKIAEASVYTLTKSATNGSISDPSGEPDSSGNLVYLAGATAHLTAVPNALYQFFNWTGTVTSTSNPLSLLMDANKSITANFSLIPTNFPFYKIFVPSLVIEVGNWFIDLFDGGRFKRKIP